jgi:Ca2+-binding RTX toxin-like protein
MRRLRGTAGDDVIVTGGARTVDARAGNDLVCVTGLTRYLMAGDGDDAVDTDDRAVDTYTYLEAGADTFVGGQRRDHVSSGAGGDRLDTGGGADSYVSYVESGPTPGADILVNLGAGNDFASVEHSNEAGVLDGGSGLNTLAISGCCEEGSQPLVVSNATETATAGGEERFRWNNFRGFSFRPYEVTGTVVFEGSDVSEVVTAERDLEAAPIIGKLDMAGGDDQVVFVGTLGSVLAGDGNDWVRAVGFADQRSLAPAARVAVDLVRDRLRVNDGSPETVRIPGVENVEVSDFLTAVLHGDRRPNTLVVGQACVTKLYGHRGADILSGRPMADRCPRWAAAHPGSLSTYGGTGDDILRARWTRDELFGGPGRDSAEGRGGADVCKAEIRRHCEH